MRETTVSVSSQSPVGLEPPSWSEVAPSPRSTSDQTDTGSLAPSVGTPRQGRRQEMVKLGSGLITYGASLPALQ